MDIDKMKTEKDFGKIAFANFNIPRTKTSRESTKTMLML